MADNWWIGDDNPYNAYRQPTAKPYEQTWRDKLAAALMGQSKSKARRDFVSGALGSTGLGTTGMGLVDLTPAGIPLAGNESRKDFNEGNYAGSLMNAMAMIPAVKPLNNTSIKKISEGIYNILVKNNNAGTISLAGNGGKPFVSLVDIYPEYRRQGVATNVYDLLEKEIGRKLVPSPLGMSDEAEKFWINRLSRNDVGLVNEAKEIGKSYGISQVHLNDRFKNLEKALIK